MISLLYSILLGLYSLVLVIFLFYYLSRRAPGGDAAVGWAQGLFYTAGLAGVVALGWALYRRPDYGLTVLAIPLFFLLLPSFKRARTALYVWWPVATPAPPLTLSIENHLNTQLHVKLECWFGTAQSHVFSLYATFDYYLQPLEKAAFPLTPHQTKLLAHKCRYASIMVYEQVLETYEGHSFLKEIQPCRYFHQETPTAFHSGIYRIVINEKKAAPVSGNGL